MKKINNGNTESVTQFFDGGNGGAVISPADNIVYGGLCYAAPCTKSVDGNITFLAQFNDPLADSRSNGNGSSLLSFIVCKKEYKKALARITSFELK